MQTLKEDVKNRIIVAAKKHFKEFGFEEASMRKIASEAGISTGNIYRYFPTKKNLLNEILMDIGLELKNFFEIIPDNYADINYEILFKTIIDKIIELYENRETDLKVLLSCKDQKQYIIFREKILELFSNKIEGIAKSMNKNFTDKILVSSIARTLFEGFAYIIEMNDSDINTLKKRMYIYIETMIIDLDKRVLKITEKVI